jgi:hypothetical protein
MAIEEDVAEGVDHYAEAEAKVREARDAMLALPAVYVAVQQANPTPPEGVRGFGHTEAQRRSARAQRLAGRLAEVLEAILEAHEDDTARAQELGIDVPPPPGVIIPMGGGR